MSPYLPAPPRKPTHEQRACGAATEDLVAGRWPRGHADVLLQRLTAWWRSLEASRARLRKEWVALKKDEARLKRHFKYDGV